MHRRQIRFHQKFLDGVSINRVIRTLIISDILVLSAFGLLGPVFAIFLLENIKGGSAEVAGFATMVMLISRAIFQIPLAVLIDRRTGEEDDFWLLFAGSVGFSAVPVIYIFASLPIHIYAIQVVYGFLLALTYPSWYAIFTRHIDERREGLEWATYNTLVDIGLAAAAGVGGVVVVALGFKFIFITVSAVALLGSFLLLTIRPSLKCRQKDKSCLVSQKSKGSS